MATTKENNLKQNLMIYSDYLTKLESQKIKDIPTHKYKASLMQLRNTHLQNNMLCGGEREYPMDPS